METLAPLSELIPDPTRPCCDWSLAFGARLREAIADDRYAAQRDKLYVAQKLLQDGGGRAVRAFKTLPGSRKEGYQAEAAKLWACAIVLSEQADTAVRAEEDAALASSAACAVHPSRTSSAGASARAASPHSRTSTRRSSTKSPEDQVPARPGPDRPAASRKAMPAAMLSTLDMTNKNGGCWNGDLPLDAALTDLSPLASSSDSPHASAMKQIRSQSMRLRSSRSKEKRRIKSSHDFGAFRRSFRCTPRTAAGISLPTSTLRA